MAGPASAGPCRLSLALGLDISGSVDGREYRLQLDGIAAALGSARVLDALLILPSAPVEIAVYEWSGPSTQRVLLGWTRLGSRADVAEAAARLRAVRRERSHPSTAVGAAMLHGARMLGARDCWARTLDLSGDGKSNTGPRPARAKADPVMAGVTVNALVVGADAPSFVDRRQGEIAELSSWFRTEVIHGPGAFVETALGYEDYERAMTRKLVRELRGMAIGGLAGR